MKSPPPTSVRTQEVTEFRRAAKHLWMPALALLLGSQAFANARADVAELPTAVRGAEPALKQVGGDDLKLFGFRVYHASLWSASGKYLPHQMLALNLKFQRAFAARELVDITLSAWKKLDAGTEASRNEWAGEISGVWQDVNEGDTLTAVVVPGGETRFYNQTGLLGRVTDAGFGPAYLSTWLDERTQLPELRAALLGLKRMP